MNILVLDVAATTSGALTILEQYYYELQADTKNHYYFCISTPELKSTGNITVLKFPWVKKSWLHRLWFEIFCVNRLVSRNKISRVFSLENLILCNPKCEQWVYLHQSLPFAEYRFGLWENPLLWTYQNIFVSLIGASLKRANRVIVQVQWVKAAIVARYQLFPESITVTPPDIDTAAIKPFDDNNESRHSFFYPATPFPYKKHQTIIDAVQMLPEDTRRTIKVFFTISGDENAYSQSLKAQIEQQNLPIILVGYLSKEAVMDFYSRSVLLFPSVIESHPMPLKEARYSQTPVIATDCAFAQELLAGYEKAHLFKAEDALALQKCIRRIIKEQ